MPKITRSEGPTNIRDSYVEDVLENPDRPAPADDLTHVEPVPDEPTKESTPEEGEGEYVDRPADNANKGEWVSYVVAITGDDEQTVNGYTKAELIELYGDE